MTTKERISYEALSLFAVKGYKGTSVKNIANAVGIKDSSLYKHYKSKQEILDTIMSDIKNRIGNMAENMGLADGHDYDRVSAFYANLSQEQLVEFSKKIFLFYLKDDLISKFWRLGTMEQFQNEQVYAPFKQLFYEDSIHYQTELFAELRRHKVLKEADPAAMAMSFYAPIFFLLSKYAGSECKENEEEALAVLDKQVREFFRIYSNK